MMNQFQSSPILYAQGSTLAEGVGVPVPRTAFGLNKGLKTEFFATPDWTGRPVATETEPLVQADWENAKPAPEVDTHNYSVRWSGTIAAPAPGHYVFTLEAADSFPVLARGELPPHPRRQSALRRQPPHQARPVGRWATSSPRPAPRPPRRRLRHSPNAPTSPSTSPTPRSTNSSLSTRTPAIRPAAASRSNGKLPPQAQLDEAVARAKEAGVVVAFVGLSPQLEGEEMPIKIPGFNGGDRTSLDLPAPQQKLLEALAATGKPLIVVLQSGSAVALNWANEHAAAVLEAWYPGVEGGTAIARTLAGLNNPAGRLPVTFYASLDGLPAFTDYSLKGRTYRYFQGKPLWGFGYGLSYSKFTYGPVKLSASNSKAGDPHHR